METFILYDNAMFFHISVPTQFCELMKWYRGSFIFRQHIVVFHCNVTVTSLMKIKKVGSGRGSVKCGAPLHALCFITWSCSDKFMEPALMLVSSAAMGHHFWAAPSLENVLCSRQPVCLHLLNPFVYVVLGFDHKCHIRIYYLQMHATFGMLIFSHLSASSVFS